MSATSRELSDILTAYLAGWKSLSDCYVWLSSVDWNDPTVDSEAQLTLGLFELLSTDVIEGFRDESEFSQEASDFVAKTTGSIYVFRDTTGKVSEFASSSDSIVRNLIPVMVGTPEEQTLSISPLPVAV